MKEGGSEGRKRQCRQGILLTQLGLGEGHSGRGARSLAEEAMSMSHKGAARSQIPGAALKQQCSHAAQVPAEGGALTPPLGGAAVTSAGHSSWPLPAGPHSAALRLLRCPVHLPLPVPGQLPDLQRLPPGWP